MAWLHKLAKKAAKRATSSAWKAITKKKKPAKPLSKADQDELSAWRFWGRSLGSLSRRLQGKKQTAPRPAPSRQVETKKPSSKLSGHSSSKASPRVRDKKKRTPTTDPRFHRSDDFFKVKKQLGMKSTPMYITY